MVSLSLSHVRARASLSRKSTCLSLSRKSTCAHLRKQLLLVPHPTLDEREARLDQSQQTPYERSAKVSSSSRTYSSAVLVYFSDWK